MFLCCYDMCQSSTLQWYFVFRHCSSSNLQQRKGKKGDSSVNTLPDLFGQITEDGDHTEVKEGFRNPLASPCWGSRLVGWYTTYISCQLMLFLSGHLPRSWLEWQHFRAPALFISDSRWHATVTFEYSVDAPSACLAIFTWLGILARVYHRMLQ